MEDSSTKFKLGTAPINLVRIKLGERRKKHVSNGIASI